MPSSQTANNQTPAIQVESLSKTYSQGLIFKKRHEALKDVTLTVNRGEIFGMLGPNGAGKTTFLKIMLGVIRKTSGKASMLGLPAGSRKGRRLVGYLPEHLRVPAHLTGYQALEYFGNLSDVPTKVVRAKREELLEMVGLAQRAKDNVRQYSKGMLQRLGLAQALLHDPELLVLDEPTDGLDPKARAEMRQIIRDLKDRGVTIFLNSHLLQEVEMVCQRVAILDKGALRYCGPVDSIGQFLQTGGLEGQDGSGSIEFGLVGDKTAIEGCFTGVPSEVRVEENQMISVNIPTATQSAIDQTVDRLRSAGVSIVSINRRRVSLEDAFLQIVDESSFKN
jgi:ABC-2 type transport system ATP-binding protein